MRRAARAIWGGAPISEQLLDDIEADTGATRAEALSIARAMIGAEEDRIILPASERPTIRLALAIAGQWRMASSGFGSIPVAFDLNAVDVAARWLRIEPSPALFEGLAVIESEALKILRKTS